MQELIPAPPDALRELVNHRTMHSKTFELPDGQFRYIARKRIVHVPGDPQTWEKGGYADWQDLDTDFVQVGNAYEVRNAWYTCSIATGQIVYSYQSKVRGEARVELRWIGMEQVADMRLRFDHRVSGNRLTFSQLVPDLDLIFVALPAGLYVYKKLYSPRAPRDFTWHIEWTRDSPLIINTTTQGQDNADQTEPNRRAIGRGQMCRPIEMRHGVEVRAPERLQHACQFNEWWTGRTFTLDPERRRVPSDDSIYPILIDQDIIQPISANIDDGYDGTAYTTWFYNQTVCFVGWYSVGSQTYLGGWRFQLAIPQGSTITLAELIINVTSVIGSGNTFDLYAEDVDNAAAFADITRLPRNISPITTASASMSLTATGLNTTNCTNAIQEVVSRPGFSSGNNVLLLQRNLGTAAGATTAAYFEDYSNAGTDEPVIEVTFTSPVGTNVSPRTMPAGWLRRL